MFQTSYTVTALYGQKQVVCLWLHLSGWLHLAGALHIGCVVTSLKLKFVLLLNSNTFNFSYLLILL